MLFQWARALRIGVRTMQKNMKSVLLLSSAVLLHLGVGLNLLLTIGLVFILYLATGGSRFLTVVIKTLPRDFKALMVLVKLKRRLKLYTKERKGVPSLFYEVCDRVPNKTGFIDATDEQCWSFREFDNYSNQIANYFLSLGYQPGESVALFMEARPQYVAVWLGLAKIGVIPALINCNLRMDSLIHCLKAAKVKSIIYGSEMQGAIDAAEHLVPNTLKLYELSPMQQSESPLANAISSASTSRPPHLDYEFNGPLMYIYTSGTTGWPKAAKVSHSRFFYMTNSIHQFSKFDSSTVVYDTLPLYHTSGGILGVGQALLQGATVVTRRKFSASNFWRDCIKYNCTAAQYIGEICRYLLAQPPKPEDRQHKVRVAYGNGLKPQIWTEFKERFGIEMITEFYGSTEGNANAINSYNVIGCVGFTSMIVPSFHPISVILVDKETGMPLRGNDGLCILAPPGQPGELVGKIVSNDAVNRFDGYSTESATSKKVASDVFAYGDRYFLTGDILYMDELGYLYFKDRTGDTFRWKGENVSTAEVEALVSNIIDKRDAVAYGVEVSGLEGRAGMVAIVDPEHQVDITSLYKKIAAALPSYSRPIFVRLLKEASKTGTFKLKKVDLRSDGFNPSVITDELFYLDSKLGQYVPLTSSGYADILSGRIRL